MNNEDLFGPLDILDGTPVEYDPSEDNAERHARGWARALKARLEERKQIEARYADEMQRLAEAKADRMSGVDTQIEYLKRAIEEAHIAVNEHRQANNLDELATWDLVHATSKSRRVPKKDLTRISLPSSNIGMVASALEDAELNDPVTWSPKVSIKEVKSLVADGKLTVADGQLVETSSGEIIEGFQIEVLPEGARTYSSTINS